MGQEIKSDRFTSEDFKRYKENVEKETLILEQLFKKRAFAKATPCVGLELEGWLIDQQGNPAPHAQTFLDQLGQDNIVPELAVFNFEINAPHYPLSSQLLQNFEKDLKRLWGKCEKTAHQLQSSTLMIGSLPTLHEKMLTLDYITPHNRYYALNEQIMKLRNYQPIEINISGDETLKNKYDCILLESAATSLQIHLEVDQDDAVSMYNASILASPFVVALCANSAFLCGKSLWSESRIPVFEQTVIVGVDESPTAKKRVTLGNGYLKESLFELYQENKNLYPPLIPHTTQAPAEKLTHVNFHNGTVWRWNRPIIGFNKDGTPHLRIEHRVLPAGPTLQDTLANIMLFLGIIHAFKNDEPTLTKKVSFEDTYVNLYAAAKDGLEAKFTWEDGKTHHIGELFTQEVYPKIKKALQELQFSASDIEKYLDNIIMKRIEKKINGAKWQKLFVQKHGKDYNRLVINYYKNQNSGKAVHEWPINE